MSAGLPALSGNADNFRGSVLGPLRHSRYGRTDKRQHRPSRPDREEFHARLQLPNALVFAFAAAVAFAGRPAFADADHHQVQPRRFARRAQGQGGFDVQAAGREVHQRPSDGRGLSELFAL